MRQRFDLVAIVAIVAGVVVLLASDGQRPEAAATLPADFVRAGFVPGGGQQAVTGETAVDGGLYRLTVQRDGRLVFAPVGTEPEPTATSTPVATSTPTATSTPVAIAPYPDAPPCPTHDDRDPHLLWDGERGCYYDHEHGLVEAPWAVALWGDWTALTGGGISYPWQTEMENEMKHPGYNWHGFDLRDYGCRPFLAGTGGVNAWYIQAHGMANAMGQQARTHSFFGMAALCNEAGPAGTMMVGGWQDFGQLVSPYKGGPAAIVGPGVYAKAPVPYNDETPPYVGLSRGAGSVETWNSNVRPGSAPFVDAHALFGFAFRIQDPVGAWQVDGSFVELGGNSSARQMYQVEVVVPAELAGADGLVQFAGFVDVRGRVDETCTAVSAVCAPLVIVDGIPGRYTVNLRDFPDAFGGQFRPTADGYYEGDVLFNGRSAGWIGPMN